MAKAEPFAPEHSKHDPKTVFETILRLL
jgi:hypothetical protein